MGELRSRSFPVVSFRRPVMWLIVHHVPGFSGGGRKIMGSKVKINRT